MQYSKLKLLFGYLILFTGCIHAIDLIFSSPPEAGLSIWICKKVVYVICSGFVFWDFILKPWLNNKNQQAVTKT